MDNQEVQQVDKNSQVASEKNNVKKQEKRSDDKEKKRKYRRDWIKAYTTNVDAFLTFKGRIRALAVEIIRDNPLITFNELVEKMKARNEIIRNYLEGNSNNGVGRQTVNRLANVRKAIDELAEEGIIVKIQLNDEPFVRFALQSQLELLRQQGVQLV